MTEGFTTITMEPRKHIALVAHDNRKQDLIEWAMEHKEELARHAQAPQPPWWPGTPGWM